MTSVAFAKSNDDVTAMRLTFTNIVVPDGLSEDSPEGTGGRFYGRDAVVVDLGGNIGKVAIAMQNAGDDTDAPYGRLFTYSDANNPSVSGLADGWYIPSKDEMEALKERLTWTSSQRYQGQNLAGAVINFETGTSLFLPAAGYYSSGTKDRGTTCAYWTSTEFYYDTSQSYKLEMNSSSKDVNYGRKTTGRSLRPFHALQKAVTHPAPIEREHNLEVSSITPTSDGVVLTVNGQSVTYPFDMLKKMTFFNGTPAVAVTANEDPDNKGNYYSTFYSSLEAYNIPNGVNAYTAEVEGENVKLTKVAGNILPQGEAVLLRSKTTSDMSMTIADEMGEKSTGNQFKGVDVSTDQDGITHYMLSYGQNKLGFYKMNSAMVLSPNKAFIALQSNSSAKALRFVFQDDMPTGINDVNADDSHSDKIFNLSGMRLNKMQKGINIVNGKKILVK